MLWNPRRGGGRGQQDSVCDEKKGFSVEKHSILLIGGDRERVRKAREALRSEAFSLSTAQNGYVALEKASCYKYEAAIVVPPLPMMEERHLAAKLKRVRRGMAVLVLTPAKRKQERETRELAEGLTLLEDCENLGERVLEAVRAEAIGGGAGGQSNKEEWSGVTSGIIGGSEAIRQVWRTIERVREKDIPILLEGESGTGKDLVARTIHFSSCRGDYPFVPVNCAAIPDPLLESELFGHEKGAFTGAVTCRIGKFEQANRGTLFLDEIADMSPRTQAKLLRVIETREFERIGGSRRIRVATRIVCATNQGLYERMEQGLFRRDLYYRVAAFRMVLPPLRQRREDIPLLARHFLRLLGAGENQNVRHISAEAMKILVDHEWKGNVRELANAIHRACVLCSGDTVLPEHWPPEMIEEANRRSGNGEGIGASPPDSIKIVPLCWLEAQAMEHALEEACGNVTAAARGLGMGRATFYRKAEKYRISFRNQN